ncbi:hypothetical protein ACJDT4_22710 [Clostridium neuense]|uniref:Lipoprotein n=1 Tax=Clostridium neuense TaxID=1728934 RepID=A0ABW8TMY0_9CLOT
MKGRRNYNIFIISLIIALFIAISGCAILYTIRIFDLRYQYKIVHPPNRKSYYAADFRKANNKSSIMKSKINKVATEIKTLLMISLVYLNYFYYTNSINKGSIRYLFI